MPERVTLVALVRQRGAELGVVDLPGLLVDAQEHILASGLDSHTRTGRRDRHACTNPDPSDRDRRDRHDDLDSWCSRCQWQGHGSSFPVRWGFGSAAVRTRSPLRLQSLRPRMTRTLDRRLGAA